MTDKYLKLAKKNNIECQDYFFLAGEFHNSELPVVLNQKIDQHLEECQACSVFDEEYQLTMQAIAALRAQAYQQTTEDKQRLRAALQSRLSL